jgi:hypothetical protein
LEGIEGEDEEHDGEREDEFNDTNAHHSPNKHRFLSMAQSATPIDTINDSKAIEFQIEILASE